MKPKQTNRRAAAVFVSSLVLVLLAVCAWAAPETRNRDSIPDKYKWDPSQVYASLELWEADLTRAGEMVAELEELRGTPTDAVPLLEVLMLRDEASMIIDHLWLYAGLVYDADTRNTEAAGRQQQALDIYGRLGEATSWIEPTLLALPAETLTAWLESETGLQPYAFMLENLNRQRAHYLDEAQEQLLSYFGTYNYTPGEVYTNLSTTDISYPTYVLGNGDTIVLSEGATWQQLRTNPNQKERREIMAGMVGASETHLNTYAASLNSIMQRNWAMARARNYATTLEASLEPENVPVAVFENLITTVKAGMEPARRYHQLRKRALGLKHYYLSDRRIPIIEFNKTYEYDEVLPWIIESLEPMGEAYQERAREMLYGRWIDVYETEGKYGGGYQTGAYGKHPYVLLNYNGTLDEVFTIAHELGHAMHDLYAMDNQPYVTYNSDQFLWEVPSTFNEALLLDYMMARTDDPAERVALLQYAIENITGTFIGQVFFADFERQAHLMVEEGRPVTAETVGDLYESLHREYYGDAMERDPYIRAYWARISHFWTHCYYVYKYATSFAASAQLVANVKGEDGEVALAKYFDLLKAGGDDYAVAQLQKAGVDMTGPEPVQAILTQLDALVTQIEVEYERLTAGQ